MLDQRITIANRLGLHARAAAKMVSTASAFESDVWLDCKGKRVNAKSIMGIMMLAAARGTEIVVITDGADEREALHAVVSLVDDLFGEEE